MNEVSTLEMASAFGTLANLGRHVQPSPVISVTASDGEVIYQAPPRADQVVEPAIAAEAVDILKGVVQSGTGVGANIGRPQFGKTGTAQNASDAWFVGAVPQMATAVWVGFPQGQVPMCCGNVRISTVYGGTWPASDLAGPSCSRRPRRCPRRSSASAPNVDYVTLRVDVTRGCLANPYTPPQDIDVLQYPAGSEPTYEVCTEPSSYQLLVVPSVIGLGRQAAISALHSAGFTVAMVLAPSDQPSGTVIAQDPGGGSRLIQTGTVTITVAKGEPLHPSSADGSERGRHAARRRRGSAPAGRVRCLRVVRRGVRPGTIRRATTGRVWSGPSRRTAGQRGSAGSTVTILVNP